jgi:hypothetical protein
LGNCVVDSNVVSMNDAALRYLGDACTNIFKLNNNDNNDKDNVERNKVVENAIVSGEKCFSRLLIVVVVD